MRAGFLKPIHTRGTIRSFREILDGEHDDIPESYFLNAGSIDDVRERAGTLVHS